MTVVAGPAPYYRFSNSLEVTLNSKVLFIDFDGHLHHFPCDPFFGLLVAGKIHIRRENTFFRNMAIKAADTQLFTNAMHNPIHFFVACLLRQYFQVGEMTLIIVRLCGRNPREEVYKQRKEHIDFLIRLHSLNIQRQN